MHHIHARFKKSNHPCLAPLTLAIASVFGLGGLATDCHAAPNGAVVVGGAAAVVQSGNATTVNQSTARAAIDWQSFSVNATETVQFNQPSANAIMLNRVLGNSASEIFGKINANGQVFLINPNGVVFRPGAEVNVGGLLASSLDMKTADFMAGRFNLQSNGSAGQVLNQGSITALPAGYIALAGPQVRNEGSLSARLGHISLMAGHAMRVNLPDSGGIQFDISESDVNALVSNGGLIRADGGVVLLAASAKDALTASVVNNTGTIEARSVRDRGGVIRLEGLDTGAVVNSGRLDASGKAQGELGGTVAVTGQYVAALDGSRMDAAGDAGGGQVNVGGSFQGVGDLRNANNTFVAADAHIDASAINTGNGGNVVVWADGTTRYFGSIKATGGVVNGYGGNAEVSGKKTLAFSGRANLSAANGAAGTLLLDPLNITLSTTADANTAGFTPPGDLTEALADDAGLTSNFNVSAGGSFNGVGAGTNIVLQASNKIDVNNSFALATAAGVANVGLALQAPTINLNGIITTDGTGVLSGNATTVNVSAAGRIQNGVNVAANTGATVNVAAGTFTEQVVIVGKDLTLSGAGQSATVIQSPANLPTLVGRRPYVTVPVRDSVAIVHVENTSNAVVQNLTVDGNNASLNAQTDGDANRLIAVGYYNAGGTVNNVTTLRTGNPLAAGSNGDGAGRGIYINIDNGSSKNVTISNTTQSQFGRGAINLFTSNGSSINTSIVNNTINGDGPRSPKFIQGGIQIRGLNVTGNVSQNTIQNIRDNYFATQSLEAIAIALLDNNVGMTVSGNTLTNNDNHIRVRDTTALTTISQNTLQGGRTGISTNSATSITNNSIQGSIVNSIYVSGAASSVAANFNSLVPAAGGIAVFNALPASGVVNAANNWWGTPVIGSVAPLVNNPVAGVQSNVSYASILPIGANTQPGTAGFQPCLLAGGCAVTTPAAVVAVAPVVQVATPEALGALAIAQRISTGGGRSTSNDDLKVLFATGPQGQSVVKNQLRLAGCGVALPPLAAADASCAAP